MSFFRSLVFLLVFLLLDISSYAQNLSIERQKEIHKKSKRVPRKFTKDVSLLSNKLCADYTSDLEKVEAISFWIAMNIEYDLRRYLRRPWEAKNTDLVLKRKVALCGEYSELFKKMCAVQGINSHIVPGYVKDYDFFEGEILFRAEHAWNMVQLNGEWQFMDLTWASGILKQRRQILAKLLARWFGWKYKIRYRNVKHWDRNWLYVKPQSMIYSHYPLFKEFQGLSVPISIRTFELGSINIDAELAYNEESFSDLNSLTPNESIDWWSFVGDVSLRDNVHNHRAQEYYFLNCLDSLYRLNFDSASGLLGGNEEDMSLMKYYADSISQLAKSYAFETDLEYQILTDRNKDWTSTVKEANKKMSKTAIKSKRLVNREMSIIKRLKSKQKGNIRYISSKTNALRENKIMSTRIARRKDYIDTLVYNELIKASDSLTLNTEKIEKRLDSLVFISTNTLWEDAVKFEKSQRTQLKQINRRIRLNVRCKWKSNQSIYPVHPDGNKKLEMEEIENLVADHIKVIGDLIDFDLQRMKEIRSIYKDYNRTIRENLKVIRQAKKLNIIEDSVNQRYVALVKNTKLKSIIYEESIQEYFPKKNALRRNLFSLKNQWRKVPKNLRKESRWEGHRYLLYQWYLKSIKYREEQIQKLLLSKNKTIHKEVKRRIKILEKRRREQEESAQG